MFGIKNARRSASHHELILACRINQAVASRPTAGLRDHHASARDNVVDLTCVALSNCSLIGHRRLQENIHGSCRGHNSGSLGYYVAFEVRSSFGIRVGQPIRRHCNRNRSARFIQLNQHGRNRLPLRPFRHHRTVIAVKSNDRRLNHLRILP